MTVCRRGDVVLVGFVFSDESGRKVRPAVVISFRSRSVWIEDADETPRSSAISGAVTG